MDPQALNWVSQSTGQHVLYIFNDTMFILVLLCWIFFFKVFSGFISQKISNEVVKVSSYALEIKGIPTQREEGAPNEREIMSHFSKFG